MPFEKFCQGRSCTDFSEICEKRESGYRASVRTGHLSAAAVVGNNTSETGAVGQEPTVAPSPAKGGNTPSAVFRGVTPSVDKKTCGIRVL